MTDDTEVHCERLADELELAEETTFEYVAEMFDVAPIDARAALRMSARTALLDTERGRPRIHRGECRGGVRLQPVRDRSLRWGHRESDGRPGADNDHHDVDVYGAAIHDPAADDGPADETPVPTTGDIYTVVQGDTLFAISQKLGVRLPDLVAANGLNENSLIAPGQQQLVVPRGD